MNACPNCTKLLPDRIRYCPYCGNEMQSRSRWLAGRVDWRFLGYWVVASLLAWGMVLVVLTHPVIAQALPRPATGAIGGLVTSLGLAAVQWVVLRHRLRDARWWLLAMPASLFLGIFIYEAWPWLAGPGDPAAMAAGGATRLALIGGMAALCRWPLARQMLAWNRVRRWVVISAGISGGILLLDAIAVGSGINRGWFLMLVFHTEGQPVLEMRDLLVAAVWGLLLGTAEYPLIWRKTDVAFWWPVTSSLGLTSGAALSVLTLSVLRGLSAAGTIPNGFSGTLVEEGVAWALAGAGLAWGQWLVLRRTSARAGWWVPLTMVGYLLGWAVTATVVPDDWLLLGAVVAGATAAVPLWLAVRADFSRARWLPLWTALVWVAIALAEMLAGTGSLIEQPLVTTSAALALSLVPGGVLAYHG